ncbi:ribonuclease HII [Gluconobacter sphaericus]|uniref:Ribonuclease HII n=1 Tax=Gluconobacter sphaericus NBRC 12467 TaxID=1307951 RepID=A0AA37SJ56_9PROT|nr:ribonuclease HII [Gluconobacter sphaericus]MBF0885698.1 ribonuclease HII [Gluconobacter sphaericus]MBS1085601.1 ribonuclease HII [Gluconobacter sphaericus]MBS1097382.1 ribonuclease HII [Gluconobacter sphaericus]MBS1099397.1 ribonuclease HII [Gluconobacter sphaericus]GBR54380.1 ribonuclease HII [Gluconobacter sphaericus NBRC 12467]
MPDYALEAAHGGLVVGIDEVGRGPLAGPVVASAVAFTAPPSETLSSLLDDSKKLTARRRMLAYEALMADEQALIGIGAASVAEIERINIAQACYLAMRRALSRLGRTPDLALVDGKHAPKLPCPIKMVIGGDGISLSIAAASIIAKVTRDRLMTRLAMRHDAYGWERNAGYGTAAHMQGLRLRGVTPHHRRGFAPIRNMIEAEAHAA